ncbi:MAG: elongator complex protein 3 [Thermodesulfobacteriota bacterium]
MNRIIGLVSDVIPLIIPVFIPHEGCPHTCVFCNQRRISGRSGREPVSPEEVKSVIREWLGRETRRRSGPAQVAFYGGSFTGLEPARQEELLAAVTPFIEQGRVQEIRVSTRPDALDSEVIDRLRRFRVSIVELGVQSMDPEVLALSRRGHGRAEVIRAVALLREADLQVGLQLMVGLPGESLLSLRRTVRQILALRPGFVRIYPVLVLQGSELASRYARGAYLPLTLEQAVSRTAWLRNIFARQGIPVIRMGLQSGPELEEALLAGPYHPAFGELVMARLMLRRTRQALRDVPAGHKIRLSIASRDHSVFQGVRSANIKKLRQQGLLDRFRLLTDPAQARGTLRKLETIKDSI